MGWVRCIVSLARFSFLLCYLRFDDTDTRKERPNENKLAALLTIYNGFVKKSKDDTFPF